MENIVFIEILNKSVRFQDSLDELAILYHLHKSLPCYGAQRMQTSKVSSIPNKTVIDFTLR